MKKPAIAVPLTDTVQQDNILTRSEAMQSNFQINFPFSYDVILQQQFSIVQLGHLVLLCTHSSGAQPHSAHLISNSLINALVAQKVSCDELPLCLSARRTMHLRYE
jgi:hypothetical protein